MVQELERHGHVLELHLAEGGPLVVLAVHTLLAEHLEQGDEPQPVAQVGLQVPDAFVHALEVLVAPACERVLLNLLPRCVLRQVLLRHRHPGGWNSAKCNELRELASEGPRAEEARTEGQWEWGSNSLLPKPWPELL
jgi:hypothetical protein